MSVIVPFAVPFSITATPGSGCPSLSEIICHVNYIVFGGAYLCWLSFCQFRSFICCKQFLVECYFLQLVPEREPGLFLYTISFSTSASLFNFNMVFYRNCFYFFLCFTLIFFCRLLVPPSFLFQVVFLSSASISSISSVKLLADFFSSGSGTSLSHFVNFYFTYFFNWMLAV